MRKSALTLLFVTMFLIMLGFGIIIPHLAYYADALGASATQIGLLMASYSAMQLIFAPLWGRISDQRGRKPVMLIGLVGNAGALALFGLSKTLPWLFVARSLSGFLSAAVLPTVMAYVADVTTEEERGKGMGLMGAAMGLGFIFGPAIGGVMGNHNLPFFAAAALSALTFVFALCFLPESLQKQASAPEGFSFRAAFGHSLTPLFLVAFISTFTFSGLETVFPLFIRAQLSYGAKEMGSIFFIMGSLAAVVQGGLLGRLINKLGEFWLVIAGLLITALGMLLLPWSTAFATLTVYVTITGIGNQIIRPTNTSWISKRSKIGQGAAIGLMDAFLSLGRVLGPPVAGKLYAIEPVKLAYWLMAALLVLAVIGLFAPLRRMSRP